MKHRALALALALLVSPLALEAQPGPGGPPPQRPGPGGSPEGPGAGQGPGDGRLFFQAQELHAIEAKVSLLLEMGRTQQAVEELRRVEAMDIPKEHPLYEGKANLVGRLAIALGEAGKKKEALDTIQKLLTDVPVGSPAEASAWLSAGVVYKQSGMPEEALKAFDKAIELSQKLARSGRRPVPPFGPGGRPPGPKPSPPKGDTP